MSSGMSGERVFSLLVTSKIDWVAGDVHLQMNVDKGAEKLMKCPQQMEVFKQYDNSSRTMAVSQYLSLR